MKPSSVIAAGFGAGMVPRAPGTAGSVLGVVFGTLCLHAAARPGLAVAMVLTTVLGLVVVPRTGVAAEDAGWIVIDEIAGQMVAMLALPRLTLHGLVLAFLLFRLFDIRKPWPIKLIDRRHDALGVMGDDLLAGAFAAIAIVVIGLIWPGLGL